MAEQPPAPPSRQQTVAIATPFYWADEVLYERHWPDGTVDYGPGTYTVYMHDNTRKLSLPPPVPSLREALGLPSKTQEKKRQRRKKKNY